MTLTTIVLDPVFDTVSCVLSNAALSLALAKVLLVRAAQAYPIFQGLITHEDASVLDFRLIGLVLLGIYPLDSERHRSN